VFPRADALGVFVIDDDAGERGDGGDFSDGRRSFRRRGGGRDGSGGLGFLDFFLKRGDGVVVLLENFFLACGCGQREFFRMPAIA
jgi:hypothetical protein